MSDDGADLIRIERQRQETLEGWTPEHDNEYVEEELIRAAECYIAAARFIDYWRVGNVPDDWPWDSEWFKPTDGPVRNLVKAGALIAAEIDRVQRQRQSSEEAQR